ncbi:hypothetical protein ACOMHN_058296 [Nucella lapillus]
MGQPIHIPHTPRYQPQHHSQSAADPAKPRYQPQHHSQVSSLPSQALLPVAPQPLSPSATWTVKPFWKVTEQHTTPFVLISSL